MAMSSKKMSKINGKTQVATVAVHVHAESVEQVGRGLFAVHLPVAELSREDALVLERLYPDLIDQAYGLLNKQAVLTAMATPAEVQAGRDNLPQDAADSASQLGSHDTPPW